MPRFSPRANRAHLIQWREWGEAAFREAAEQNKPIFLLIGAFWCGFCQRMDETAFSDDEAIAILNAFFIPIRVEESQRPDIDLRYNQNGWPTIVFLTPGEDILFSVNYLDAEPLVSLLAGFIDRWEREGAVMLAAPAAAGVPVAGGDSGKPAPLRPEIVSEIAGMVEGLADPIHGGFGGEDKLLHTEATEFLLHLYEATGEQRFLEHVLLTLDTLRRSSTFDAEAGGFFRYSSRRDWQEPHREKLLDDQAALLGNFLHTYVLTDDASWRQTAEGLIDFLDADLLDRELGVYGGCQDYVRQGAGVGPWTSVVDGCIYCDANAHVASAYLTSWWLLGSDACRIRGLVVIEWLWTHLRAANEGMYHYWDGEAQGPGLLTDVVELGRALLEAHAVLGEPLYLRRSVELAEYIIRHHRAPAGGFFDISGSGRGALGTKMTVLAQNAAAASFFLRLAELSGEGQYRAVARWALQPFPNSHRRYGVFAAGYGHALARLLTTPVNVTIAGPPGDAGVRQLLRETLTNSRPSWPVVRFRETPAGDSPVLVSAGPQR